MIFTLFAILLNLFIRLVFNIHNKFIIFHWIVIVFINSFHSYMSNYPKYRPNSLTALHHLFKKWSQTTNFSRRRVRCVCGSIIIEYIAELESPKHICLHRWGKEKARYRNYMFLEGHRFVPYQIPALGHLTRYLLCILCKAIKWSFEQCPLYKCRHLLVDESKDNICLILYKTKLCISSSIMYNI